MAATQPPAVATPAGGGGEGGGGAGGGGGGGGGSEWALPSGVPQLDGAKQDNESMYSFIGPSPLLEGTVGGTTADENFGITEPTRGGWGSPVSDPGSPQEGVSPTRARGGRGSIAVGSGGGGVVAPPKVCIALWLSSIR